MKNSGGGKTMNLLSPWSAFNLPCDRSCPLLSCANEPRYSPGRDMGRVFIRMFFELKMLFERQVGNSG